MKCIRKGFIGAITGGLLVPVLATAMDASGGPPPTQSRTGKANLHQINRSGIKARIEFQDDGTTLTVTGTATGLDAGESYVTLIYDTGSVPSGTSRKNLAGLHLVFTTDRGSSVRISSLLR